jgi:peroxiredoxin (alkyl hydroperoxide reductase subunit C)
MSYNRLSTLVGRSAPDFTSKAVLNGNQMVEDFSLRPYRGKAYVVLFFYPKDFTFVCPTELHAFQAEKAAFEERSVQLVACSTDTEFSHWAWLHTSKSEGGIRGVTYPMVADVNKVIANAYGVLAGRYVSSGDTWEAEGERVAYRGLFLIDKEGIVQHQVVNHMPLGRSVKETLRVVDALQHFEQYGEVCPIDWHKGERAMLPSSSGLQSYFK